MFQGTTVVTGALGPGVQVSIPVVVRAKRGTWRVDAARAKLSPVQLGTQRWPFATPEYAFPLVSEGDTIRVLIERLRAMRTVGVIVVVDDGSTDGTLDALTGMAAADRSLRVVRRQRSSGFGVAIKHGLSLAIGVSPGGRIAQLDADLSHAPESLRDLLGSEADLVIGSRYVGGGRFAGVSLFRVVISRTANVLCRLVLGVRVRDATSGFRLYSRRAVDAILLGSRTSGYEFLPESVRIVERCGFTVVERPISYVARRAGRSKLRARHVLQFSRFLVSRYELHVEEGDHLPR